MKKYLSSIIVIILSLLASYRLLFPSECRGLIDGLWLLIWCSILILYLLLLVAISVFEKIKNKNKNTPNYRPYLSLILIFGVIGFILFIQSEIFKSKCILNAKSYWQELILRQDKSYELISNEPEYSCKEEGNFKVSNDTLYLFETPKYNKTLIFNKKFVLNYKLKILKPIVNDSIDNKNIFKILMANLKEFNN